MKRKWFAFFICLLPVMIWPTPSPAFDPGKDITLHGLMDARFTRYDSTRTWLTAGMGKTRYGHDPASPDSDTSPDLAEIALEARARFGWAWTGNLVLKYDPEKDKTPVDVTEAFLAYKSLPNPKGLRIKSRLGAFFPQVSLENHGRAWTSTYAITPSAINSWIGQEVRTIGAELTLQTPGENLGPAHWNLDDWDVALLGAAFMANDPAGTYLAWQGWSLHDRKAGLFDRMPLPPLDSIGPGGTFDRQVPWIEPFHEIDDRVGFYTGLNIHHRDHGSLHLLYYENNGDGGAFDGEQYAWDTRFLSIGTRLFLPLELEFLAQYMTGDTAMGPADEVNVDFWSFYTLLTRAFGDRHRFTLRFDRFTTHDRDALSGDNNDESGWSWLAAWTFDPAAGHRITTEYLSVTSDRPERARYGWDSDVHETCVQVSYQFFFDLP
ncbi:MAG TPA: hypothetical protein DHV36_12360 [Desulfobacteraceae bacterium]|nr:hypothetical protein [Desulfobacteraceae bacterium]